MDGRLATIAARQHGTFTRAQAASVGATEGQIRHRLHSRQWVRVGPGVYRLAGVPVNWRQRALAACLVSGAGAVVSHRSAGALWEVSGFRPGPLELTVPARAGSRNALARVHRSDVPTRDRTKLDRIPSYDQGGCSSR